MQITCQQIQRIQKNHRKTKHFTTLANLSWSVMINAQMIAVTTTKFATACISDICNSFINARRNYTSWHKGLIHTDTFCTLQHNYKVHSFQKGGKRYYIHKWGIYKCTAIMQNYLLDTTTVCFEYSKECCHFTLQNDTFHHYLLC